MVEDWEFLELRNKVRQLDGAVKGLKADIEDLRLFADELEAAGEELREKLDRLESSFEEVKRQVGNLHNRLGRLEELVRKLVEVGR